MWAGEQTCHKASSTANGEDPAAWAKLFALEYLDVVGRGSWLDHCLQDRAEWAREITGLDATSLGLRQTQRNGLYDDPYMQYLAGRAINAIFAALALYESAHEHMDWVIAVDHQGALIEQKSCRSLYTHLPNEKPVCTQ